MEKVKIISVKPIPSSVNDEYSHTPSESETIDILAETENNDSGKLLHENSLQCKRSKASTNNFGTSNSSHLGLRNVSNSSFKNSTSLSSTKVQEIVNKNMQYKTGFSFPVSSSNCFGRSNLRASYNERIRSGPLSLQNFSGYQREKKVDQGVTGDFVYLAGNAILGSGLYRSNSSLELDHDTFEHSNIGIPFLKREYGSHGSINVATALCQESIYSVFHNYNKELKEGTEQFTYPTSPKVRSKIHRLWEKDKSYILKKILPSKGVDNKCEKIESSSEIHSILGGTVILNSNAKASVEVMDTDKDDIPTIKSFRRAAIAHYDCHSLAVHFNSLKLKAVLADRSNSTTGASAAALADSLSLQNAAIQGSSEELSLEDVNHGDGQSNHLVSSCPFFLNEIGGAAERIVNLSREIIFSNQSSRISLKPHQLYRTASASSISILEPLSGASFWNQTLCPYTKKFPILEIVDQGSNFYSNYFHFQEHQNWFGIDDTLGPLAISIKKEKLEESCIDKNHSLPSYQYRFIFRTSELFNCQGTIREENLSQRGDKSKGQGIREAIEYVFPQLNLNCLRLGTSNTETEASLKKLDELGIHRKFKVGVLYCHSGQKTEEEMYNNEHSGPAFSEFLEVLGQRVRLKNFDKYIGGLDKKTDSTGNYSVYTQYQGCEIMFHVSTLLPFTPTNRKQLLRKRHIGNDIVTIIFQEPGALPFTPKNIRSHFQHIFVIIQAINPCTENTHYRLAVSRFEDVPMFGPPILENATFPKSKKFVDFLLAKVINGEIAALRSEKFACMAARTKHEYLKDLALNHTTTTCLDTSTKFSLIGFSRASKKEKSRFKYVADASVKGGLSWYMSLYDATLQKNVDCVLAISVDSLVVLEESSSSVIFAASCRNILGWTIKFKQGLHVFYHQGECLILNLCSRKGDQNADEILSEIVVRLSAVTQGAESQELVLKRNPAGLLGFNVQQDGIITEVEPYGFAAQSGLQQGARLVEICTVALATLSQEQMVDLLKTSMTVTVTVIPPHVDGSPRRGCNLPTCHFLLGCSEGDYENLTPPEQVASFHGKGKILKQLIRGDRSLSPLHSGNNSGYGTGSSSHSSSLERSTKTQTALYEGPFCLQDSGPAKEKSSHHLNSKESGTIKFSDYTGTLSSNSLGHSNDQSRETTTDDPNLNKPSLIKFPSHLQSTYLEDDRDSSPPPPLPVRLFQDELKPREGLIHSRQSLPKSTDASLKENMPGSRSEEEHSCSSETLFPGLQKPKGGTSSNTTSSPSLSSRNHSPHSFTTVSASHKGDIALAPSAVKLKQSIYTYKNTHHKNSEILSNTNLQEELLKLINPDYLSDSECMGAKIRENIQPESGTNKSTDLLPNDEENSHFKEAATGLQASSASDIYDSLPILCQTIGAAKFASHKDVFSKPIGDHRPQGEFDEPKELSKGIASHKSKSSAVTTTKSHTNEGLLLTARPATVISNASTTSSPAYLEGKEKSTSDVASGACRLKDVQCAPKNSATHVESLGQMPATQISEGPPSSTSSIIDEEWNTLVNTATLAFEKIGYPASCQPPSSKQPQDSNGNSLSSGTIPSLPEDTQKCMPVCLEKFLTDSKPTSRSPSINNTLDCEDDNSNSSSSSHWPQERCTSLPSSMDKRMHQLVVQLKRALASEQQLSGKLKEEVAFLRSENTKLLKDSRAAAQQLHHFTEWFFKNIHKS